MPHRTRHAAGKAFVLLGIAMALGYRCTPTGSLSDDDPPGMANPDTIRGGPSDFRCEGKTHCSEMRSCEEAVYYLENCPDTQMDGDGDGVPCESQWCG